MIRDYLGFVVLTFIAMLWAVIGIMLVIGAIAAFVWLPLWLSIPILIVCMALGSILIVGFVYTDRFCYDVKNRVELFLDSREARLKEKKRRS